jgi:CheY-like chemotaxis protein
LRAIEEGFMPDAVLCDYQLANHRTGAQALAAVRDALRRRGREQVVTLLITGDMASEELQALARDGIPVLHKPVTAARLRRTLEMLWQQAEMPAVVEFAQRGQEAAAVAQVAQAVQQAMPQALSGRRA